MTNLERLYQTKETISRAAFNCCNDDFKMMWLRKIAHINMQRDKMTLEGAE